MAVSSEYNSAVEKLKEIGLDEVPANYVAVMLAQRKPENLTGLVSGKYDILSVQRLKGVIGGYQDRSPATRARIIRAFVSEIDLTASYGEEDIPKLVAKAEERASGYLSSDLKRLVESHSLVVFQREELSRMGEQNNGLTARVESIEGALKAKGVELAAAQQRIEQQNEELGSYRDRLDGVLANLRKEADELRATREAMKPAVDLRRHQTLRQVVV